MADEQNPQAPPAPAAPAAPASHPAPAPHFAPPSHAPSHGSSAGHSGPSSSGGGHSGPSSYGGGHSGPGGGHGGPGGGHSGPGGPGGPRPQGRPGGPAKRGKRNFIRKKKVCRFCVDKSDFIDYKKAEILGQVIQERGKILPRRMTGTCARHQRWLTVASKRAQTIALRPLAADLWLARERNVLKSLYRNRGAGNHADYFAGRR